MYSCPHCTRRSVPFAAKWISSQVLPLACRACGGLSYVPGSRGSVLLVCTALLLTAGGFLAVFWRSGTPLVAAALIALALSCARVHTRPLARVTSEEVAQARSAEGVSLFMVLLAAVMH